MLTTQYLLEDETESLSVESESEFVEENVDLASESYIKLEYVSGDGVVDLDSLLQPDIFIVNIDISYEISLLLNLFFDYLTYFYERIFYLLFLCF